MKIRRKFVLPAAILGVPLLLLCCLLGYLKIADLSGWRDTVGRLASGAIGRELKINGEFSPEIGFATRVHATDITLGNPEWSDNPHMVSIDSLSGEIDLWSIIVPPLTIRDIEISGARVRFETDPESGFNWALGSGEPSSNESGVFEMVIENAALTDVELTYSPATGHPLEAVVKDLEFTDDGTGMLDLKLGGTLEEDPLEITGRLGTFTGLINAKAIKHDLSGRFADTNFGLRGTIDDLSSLTGVDSQFSAGSAEISSLTESLGLGSALHGPFTMQGNVKPSSLGSGVTLDVSAGDASARVDGNIDSLTRPENIDATLTASGPSLHAVGTLTGTADLPDEAFSVSGGVQWEGFPIQFKQLEIAVGDNTLTADGILGAPPHMLGTDFTLQGGGPNASAIGTLFGVDLPRDRFSIDGRLERIAGGLEVKNLEARIGRTVVSANGRVGDPPDYTGTTATIHSEGPEIAQFNALVGFELPAGPFTIDGRLARGDGAITLEGVSARLGGMTLRADGLLKIAEGLSGTVLKIDAQGPDAGRLRALSRLRTLPSEAWSLAGGLVVVDSGLRLDAASASVGSLTARADGRVATARGAVGTDLRLHVEDSDLSHLMAIFGADGLPSHPVRADGGLKIEDSGYRLDKATATVGDIELAVDGLISGQPDLESTQAQVTLHGPRLSSLGPFIRQPGLPEAPFSVSGGVQVSGGRVSLDDLVAEVDSNRLEVRGTVAPSEGLVGTDVHIGLTVPDLGRMGRLAAGLTTVPDLPAERLTLTTHLRIDDEGYAIDGLHMTLDRAEAKVHGRVGTAAKMVGTDLTIVADGPNPSLFSALTGVTVPAAPFKLRGRVQRTEDAYHFDRVAIQLGGHSVKIHGSLGEAPRLIGTDLEIHASGDDTGLIAELSGARALPAGPFSLSGHFHGTPEKFTVNGLEIALGHSDLTGSAEVDIRGKPSVTATVSSRHLDLRPYLNPPGGTGGEISETDQRKQAKKNKRVFSDTPIDFSSLQRVDGEINITIDSLQMPLKLFHDVNVDAGLDNGRLEVSRFEAVGQNEGRGSATFVVEPVGGGHRLHAVLDLESLRFDLGGTDRVEPMARPPFDLSVDIEAVGRSPRELATSSNGRILMVARKGEMDNSALNVITADILLTLLKAFNPFAKDESVTEFQCAVLLLEFEGGFARLEPMVAQSDTMTMLGSGKVNLDTENLNFEWVTKPRKGIGISASMITNPYIKLGGTLGNPAIELKPMQAAASTGVAVATMGISLVAKGMFDRVTAEKKVCKTALEKIEARRNSPVK